MISNEQRAHDLAIAGLQYILSNPLNSQVGLTKSEDGNIQVDVFKIYLELYNSSLVSVNREFAE